MAGNLIPLDEAAEMLGVTPDELSAMRQKNEIFGYRDGASWKFKMEEIERVAEERGVELKGGAAAAASADEPDFEEELGAAGGSDLQLSPLDNDEAGAEEESVLVSEESLGASGESTSSTIIGKSGAEEVSEDSDLKLAAEEGSTGSEVELVQDAAGTDLNLIAGGSDALAADEVAADDQVAAGDEAPTTEPSTDKLIGTGSGAGDDELEISVDSGLTLGDDDLEIGGDMEAEVTLGGEASDEDSVLGGSGPGSDLTLGASDSGINLSPTDSGLSLEEEPIDLGGSSVEQLELPEDDDVIALEDEIADPDAATQLKADDEFLLTPVEEAEDESSGSQVIALEDSDMYADQDAQTMLGAGAEEAQPALVAEDADLLGGDLGVSIDKDAAATAQPMPMPAGAAAGVLPEKPYTIWNVLFLLFVFVVLMFSGIMFTDLIRSLWMYEEPMTLTTTIMDSIAKIFEK